jgi:hypothetical protein
VMSSFVPLLVMATLFFCLYLYGLFEINGHRCERRGYHKWVNLNPERTLVGWRGWTCSLCSVVRDPPPYGYLIVSDGS